MENALTVEYCENQVCRKPVRETVGIKDQKGKWINVCLKCAKTVMIC